MFKAGVSVMVYDITDEYIGTGVIAGQLDDGRWVVGYRDGQMIPYHEIQLREYDESNND